MIWMNRRKQRNEWCFRDLFWKLQGKTFFCLFNMILITHNQSPKPERHSYSQEDKRFITTFFNLKFTFKFTTWKDKSEQKCYITHLSCFYRLVIRVYFGHVLQCFSQISVDRTNAQAVALFCIFCMQQRSTLIESWFLRSVN